MNKELPPTITSSLRRAFRPMSVHYGLWWIPERAVALCIGRHVFTAFDSLSQWTLDHEEMHVIQYAAYGIIPYLMRWLYWTWKYGYANNPFEVEAREF